MWQGEKVRQGSYSQALYDQYHMHPWDRYSSLVDLTIINTLNYSTVGHCEYDVFVNIIIKKHSIIFLSIFFIGFWISVPISSNFPHFSPPPLASFSQKPKQSFVAGQTSW